jgi:hypothetical protein
MNITESDAVTKLKHISELNRIKQRRFVQTQKENGKTPLHVYIDKSLHVKLRQLKTAWSQPSIQSTVERLINNTKLQEI